MMGNFETPGTKGLSQRELLLEVRRDVKDFREEVRDEVRRVDAELALRPTRDDVRRTTGVGLAIATFIGGLVFGIISAV
jgi:hypothetical protein